MATLAQFRTVVSSKLGLDNTAASAEQVLVDGWLNEGVIEVLLALQCYVTTGTLSTVAGTGDYSLATTTLLIKDLFITDVSSQMWQMERVAPEEILYLRRITTATSAPPRFYALNGANMLMLYPIPSEVDVITFYQVPRPTALSSAADDPSNVTFGGIPTEYHKLIEWWALKEGADYDDDGSSQGGLAYQQKYDAKVKEYRKRMHQKGGRHLPRKLPAAYSRSFIPPRNDIDIPRYS